MSKNVKIVTIVLVVMFLVVGSIWIIDTQIKKDPNETAENAESEDSAEGETVTGLVRIYDVIPQGWEYTDYSTQAQVIMAKEGTWSGEANNSENASGILSLMEEVVFKQHMMRVGPFKGIGDESITTAGGSVPYVNHLPRVRRACDYDIEYIVFDNWEELKLELEESMGDGVTKLVLFNNSYEKSLIQELQSGSYADLRHELEEFDFYNEEKYDQSVLNAGVIDGRQVAVPLLYNISGMIQGESKQVDSNMKILSLPDPIEGKEIDYLTFIEMLIQQMENRDGGKTIDFISAALEEKIEPELFLTAAGMKWEDYEKQKEVFELLIKYYQTYMNTQMDEAGLTQQYRWAFYWNETTPAGYDRCFSEMPNDIIIDLKLDRLENRVHSEAEYNFPYFYLGNFLLDSCVYIVENSTAEEIVYHSMAGLLEADSHYVNGTWMNGGGTMGYWPIGTFYEESICAAQPNNYVAVIDGDGSLEQAVHVIESMLDCETDIYYGFSLNKETRDEQLQNWEMTPSANVNNRELRQEQGKIEFREAPSKAVLDGYAEGTYDHESRVMQIERLRNQLDNVGFAQIADREVLSIWQETVAETVDSNLSAEAGFELLCERMDEFYE